MTSKNTIDIAREIQALAQSGLTFTKDPFDRERYQHLQKLSVQLVLRSTSHPDEYIAKIFSAESGYATPKLDVRSAVFKQNKILLIKERDSRKWTLPGGYIDVNETLSEAAAREVLEETGYSVSVNKIAAIFDHRLHGHKPHLYHFYKIYLICDLKGGAPVANLESEECEFFDPQEVENLELDPGRAIKKHILRMFEHHQNLSLPADFD